MVYPAKRPSRKTLERLYCESYLTLNEIASRYKARPTSVAQWLVDYGIPRRRAKHGAPKPTPEELSDAYHNRGLSVARIALAWGASAAQVRGWLGLRGRGSIAQTGYRVIWVEGIRKYEHRHIMEQHLGRSLATAEHVHHINGNKLDNRLENLLVMDGKEHWKQTIQPGWLTYAQAKKRVRELTDENLRLTARIERLLNKLEKARAVK